MEVKKSFFDIVSDINTSRTPLSEDEVVGITNKFMVNRALSKFPETIFYADEANSFLTNVPEYAHYLFFFYSIPKKKRFAKWEKKEAYPEEVTAIQQVYQVSEQVALEYYKLLTEDQLDAIMEKTNIGGRIKKGKTNGKTKKADTN